MVTRKMVMLCTAMGKFRKRRGGLGWGKSEFSFGYVELEMIWGCPLKMSKR